MLNLGFGKPKVGLISNVNSDTRHQRIFLLLISTLESVSYYILKMPDMFIFSSHAGLHTRLISSSSWTNDMNNYPNKFSECTQLIFLWQRVGTIDPKILKV